MTNNDALNHCSRLPSPGGGGGGGESLFGKTRPDFPNVNIQFIQFSSVAQSCPTLCDPIEYSMLGFSVLHQLPELA